jgi:4-hydroxy-tetrahydrodipicolinate reductase
MNVTKVAVVGADGRMGQTTCRAVAAADGLELVARVSLGDSMSTATEAGAQVMVDFTAPDAVMANIEAALKLGLHCVIGTSGFDDVRID